MAKPLILLVDDSPLNLEVLGRLLEGHYATAIARDGAKALEFVRKRQPDLILLDIMMPDIDGFEVCKTLKASEATRDIPIIFLTAKTETEDIVKGFKLGAADYILKPFQKEELLVRIENHLALRQAKQELQTLNATKDRFFSIIAHDLRTPFTGLLGLTQVLIENIEAYSADKLKSMLHMQYEAVQNLLALLENLLTWARIQRGGIEYHPQLVNLHDVVKYNLSLIRPHASQKQITIQETIAEHLVVTGDIEMLNTVIRNLLSNAVKFTPPGGTVTLTATQDDRWMVVSIADTGIGIDPAGVAKLFRIDAPYRRPGTAGEKGTGLGLILCHEFVARHGGQMSVESVAGKGSLFKVTLPKAA